MNLEALVSSGISDVQAEAMLGTLALGRILDADIPAAGAPLRQCSVVVHGDANGAKKLTLPSPGDFDVGEGERITVFNARTKDANVQVSGFLNAAKTVSVGRGRTASFVYVNGGWANH